MFFFCKSLSSLDTRFKKNCIYGKTAYSFPCLHTIEVWFYFNPLSTAFEISNGGLLTHVFCYSFLSKTTLSNLKFGVNELNGLHEAYLHKLLRSNFFSESSANRDCQIIDHVTFFLFFLTFLKNYSPKS